MLCQSRGTSCRREGTGSNTPPFLVDSRRTTRNSRHHRSQTTRTAEQTSPARLTTLSRCCLSFWTGGKRAGRARRAECREPGPVSPREGLGHLANSASLAREREKNTRPFAIVGIKSHTLAHSHRPGNSSLLSSFPVPPAELPPATSTRMDVRAISIS